jgi:Uma2 family endonuclease
VRSWWSRELDKVQLCPYIFIMNWQEVCENPALQDLPFKIELNRFGQIVMSPASNWHGALQMRIGSRLLALGGELISECSVQTSDSTKVADVAWLSKEFVAEHGMATPYLVAPEICVEILSPSNSKEEMKMKRDLYFEAGAMEVWECDQDGVMTFYGESGVMERSEIAPDFPARM